MNRLYSTKSNKSNMTWTIKSENKELTEQEMQYISDFVPDVWHDPNFGIDMCYDQKMPSGRWISGIGFSKDRTVACACVCCW